MNFNKLFYILILLNLNLFAQQTFTGVVKPIYDVQLSVPIDGPILKLFVKEGSIVKKGDKLLKLDDQLQQLETKRRKIVWKDKSKINTLIKEEAIVLSLLKSTKNLYKKTGAVSQDEVKSIELKYLSTLGEMNSLKENEKKEKIEYKIAKEMLSKYILNSPINGTVTKIVLQAGEWARMGEAIIRIVNTTTCFIDMNINKEFMQNIKKSQSITIKLVVGEKEFIKKGKIVFISPVADSASGLVWVKAEFNNNDLKILPGLAAEVNFDIK